MADTNLICTVAIELSQSRWVIGALAPRGTKVSINTVPGGDGLRLMEYLGRLKKRLTEELGEPVELKVCFEAGYDGGFWLARFLRDRGVEVYVLDASSFLVSRRGRRTKTDLSKGAEFSLKVGAEYSAVWRMVCGW
jgi:transposase